MFGALILAGGTGGRFGEKKALTKLGSMPLSSYVVEKVSGFANEVVVAIGRDDRRDEYRRVLPREVMVTKDRVAGRGPIAGILAGMGVCARNTRRFCPAILPSSRKMC
jgi:molybdopterin-guanine dinucleotide biosynthesis protein A